MSYITEFKNISTMNLVELSAKDCGNNNQAEKDAKEAVGRLLHAVEALNKNASIGWKICFGKGHGMYAFSSGDSGLTVEDYEWIFQDCVKVNQIRNCTQAGHSCEKNNVYILKYDSEIGHFCDSYSQESIRKLFEMVSEYNMEIHVVASGIDAGGMILVIAKDKIPVRVKSLFSMSFICTKLCEMTVSEDTNNDTLFLPEGYFINFAADLLEVAMRMYSGNQTTLKSWKGIDGEIYTEFTPLEKMELSIRSCNCLKRAGVHNLGALINMTREDLMHVRNLGRSCMEEIQEKLNSIEPCRRNEPEEKKVYYDRLAELIGLHNVKEQVKRITAYARMKMDMEAMGMTNTNVVLNMEFRGNPGTAKTTVARIMAGILYEAGILQNAEILEVGRADLVAKYTGQTADNIKNIFREAKGRLLFIDEAYSLVDDRSGSYGDEAINTIVQETENHREDTVVVFAGYPDQMEEFFSRNPGLRSRVPFHITFDDYSAGELFEIVEFESEKRGFHIAPIASDKIKDICQAASKEADFGNGRFCRNLVENAMMNYAVRKYDISSSASEKDFALDEKDFVMPQAKMIQKTVRLGFCA